MNLNELESFLNQNQIPKIKRKPKTFLGIAKQPHYENVLSNIYAFYFRVNEAHKFKDLFISSLLACIKSKLIDKQDKKEALQNFSDFEVETEFSTNKGGRIDIVLQDLVSLNTILIENKINHRLDNDLKEYWDFFTIDDAIKVGVLLTLNPHVIPDNVLGKFINITHWEWISAVKETLDINSMEDEAYKIYVNDFFNTIENLSTTYTMNESAKFFFKNASQINNAYDTLVQGHSYLKTQYELIAEKLGLQTYGSDINWRNFWDEENHLNTFITIVSEDLISGKVASYKIILELMRNDKDRIPELDVRFQMHPQYLDKFRGQTQGLHCHFLVKEYEISLNELDQFAEIVVSNIKKDFNNIFIEVIEYLYPEKDISNWKHNFLN
ncbi:PD-(D/E)XK nuclease family protein [Polaribacter sp.]|uniref:PD-(D/E)XK nuclease family protein n=1 Tax=Polaribacter sp. TaxID=1920175 RepID=UPI003EF3642F